MNERFPFNHRTLAEVDAAEGAGGRAVPETVPIFATYRPSSDRIAVFVGDAPSRVSIDLTVDETRRIHGALGQALALADCRDEPLRAVKGMPA